MLRSILERRPQRAASARRLRPPPSLRAGTLYNTRWRRCRRSGGRLLTAALLEQRLHFFKQCVQLLVRLQLLMPFDRELGMQELTSCAHLKGARASIRCSDARLDLIAILAFEAGRQAVRNLCVASRLSALDVHDQRSPTAWARAGAGAAPAHGRRSAAPEWLRTARGWAKRRRWRGRTRTAAAHVTSPSN